MPKQNTRHDSNIKNIYVKKNRDFFYFYNADVNNYKTKQNFRNANLIFIWSRIIFANKRQALITTSSATIS